MKQVAIATVGLAALLMTGCSQGGFSERKAAAGDGTTAPVGAMGDTSPLSGKVLKYAINTNPTAIDPAVVQDGDTLDLLHNVYEGLVGWSPDNEPVGLVAEKWEVKDGGKTYLFRLRKGVKFHNGKPVTADDVKWSLERACTPSVKSTTVANYLDDIVGVKDMIAGKAKDIPGVKVVAPDQVEVTLVKAVPYFLGKLTYLASAIVPKGDLPLEEIKDIKHAIGTGPFKFRAFAPNQMASLQANTDYWGGKPKLDGIERPVVLDSQTRLNKFKNGEVDLLYVQRTDVKQLKADAKFGPLLKSYDRPSTYYVAMNQGMYEPFKKREVRQAFAMAIDRKKIVDEMMDGLNTRADGIVPPGIKGSQRPGAKVHPFDPARAKELLKQAGYPDPSKMPALTINFREGQSDVKLVGETVAMMVTQNLGIPVSAQPMEWGAYLEKNNKNQIPFYHMRWAADYLDPQNFLSLMLTTTGAENHCGYNSKEYDDLCAKADSLMSWEERLPIYAQAEDIMLQDAPWVPVYFQKDYELVGARVSGMRESLFGHLPHTTTEVK